MTILQSIVLGGFAALATLTAVNAECQNLGGNYYCNSVQQIIYDNVGFDGTYQEVVDMDLKACTCNYATRSFSGSFAPLNEELSVHFRGPLHMKQFVVYQPNPAGKKKREEHAKRHAHHVHHKRGADFIVTEKVTKTATVMVVPTPKGDSSESSSTEPPAPEGTLTSTSGAYVRTAYYNAESQSAKGLVFMNHKGASSDFDVFKCAGFAPSYMSSDTKSASTKPQILQDAPIASDDEFIIFSDTKCDSSCGAYREEFPAYKGFSGSQKIFAFEFSMPEDNTGSDLNRNMPAIWSLNARIPRTAQYGIRDQPCNCWGSGCGEFDLFEVLKGGEQYMTSHIHSKQGAIGGYGGGGSPDYMMRPFNEFIKAAVVFDGAGKAYISILPSDTKFPESFDIDFLDVLKGNSVPKTDRSSFRIPDAA